MATDKYLKPYIDSSVFIAWIHHETVAGVNRFEIADDIIKKAERGEYPIYISTLTLAEVHKLPRGNAAPLTKEEDEMIIRFFSNDFFKVLPVDRDIGESANRFCREFGIHGNDAIHLACALRAACDVLLVWDRPLSTKVQHPSIRVEEPRLLGQRLLTLRPDESQAKTEPTADANAEAEQRQEPPIDSAGLRRDAEGAPADAAGGEANDDGGDDVQAEGGKTEPQEK